MTRDGTVPSPHAGDMLSPPKYLLLPNHGLSSLLIGIKEYLICLAWYYIVGITFGGDRTEENSFYSLEVMYSLVRRVGIVTREKSRIRIGLEEVLLCFIIDRNR